MKFNRYWNNGSPAVQAYFSTEDIAVSVHQEFCAKFGCFTGYRRVNNIILSGVAAIEFLKFHNQPLGDFDAWQPKNDSRKFYRLTDSVFIEEARRFKTRGEWKKNSNAHYQHIRKHRRHLLEACTAHMASPGSPFREGYQVYAYEFSDHSTYIGITCNPTRRHRDHLKKGPVANNIKAGISYVLKTIQDGLKPTQAGELERVTIQNYWDQGWMVLNTHKGGSTGQIRTKYTYEKLLEIAKSAKARKQFQLLDNGAYQYACNHGLIDRLAAEFDWPLHVGHVWTKEKCLQEARKFRRLSDWAACHPSSYQAAWKHGWKNEIKQSVFVVKT